MDQERSTQREMYGQKLGSSGTDQTRAEAEAATAWANSIGGDSTGNGGSWRPGRSTSWAVWREELTVFEVLQPRGDSFRSMGSVWQGKTILYAEEGVWLAERGMLAVHPPPPLKESGNTELSSVERSDGPLAAASATTGSERAPASSPSFSEALTLPRKLATSTQSRESGASTPPTEEDSTAGEESACWTRKAGKVSRFGHGKYRDRDFSFFDRKNARTGVGGAASQFLSTGVLLDVLPRAGVSWECYRAYAELKRRSFIVRRRPEDTIGCDDHMTALCAPALSWFGETPTASSQRSICTTADPSTAAAATSTTAEARDASHPFLPVTFHVYVPNTAFRKSQPGPPDFCLAVCRFGDPMPEHSMLVSLAERCAETCRSGRRDKGVDVRARGRNRGGSKDGASPFSREGESSSGDPGYIPQGEQSLQRSDEDEQQGLLVGAVVTRGAGSEMRGVRQEKGGSREGRKENLKGGERMPRGLLKVAVVSEDGSVHVFDIGRHGA